MRDLEPVPRIYAIADAEALAPLTPAEAVRQIVAAGIRWVQLRAKRLADGSLYREAVACREAAAAAGARLWIDDRADVAALVDADGVHLGQRDLPPVAAAASVGRECWIGRSTHGLDQVREADADPRVDLIALGPIFPTRGKRDPDPVVGLETLAAARRLTAKPLVAIGGIDAGRLPAVLRAGADAAAMIGAVCRGPVAANCERLRAAAEAA
ncbi:MAG: thiamine phosphate synthase [Thermoanaerobaculia bacterium]|nr:thiamine phosphate synthase [Thermoanaerobaculia bacterium]